MGPTQSQGRAEPQLQTLTQKTCLKEPAAVPRCPLGQPAWPLGPKGCIISLPPQPPGPRLSEVMRIRARVRVPRHVRVPVGGRGSRGSRSENLYLIFEGYC